MKWPPIPSFENETSSDAEDTAACSRLPFKHPHWSVVLAVLFTLPLMTFYELAFGRRLPLYIGTGLATLVGSFFPALLILLVFGLRIRRPQIPTIRQLAYAAWMAIIFSLTAAFLTGFVAACMLFVSQGTNASSFFQTYLTHRNAHFDALLGPTSPIKMGLALCSIAIVPGLCEEFFFRGVLYRMMNGVAVWKRVLFIGILFGAIHFDLAGFVALSLFGIALTTLRALSGSWVIGAVVHMGFNATALGLALLPSSKSGSSTAPSIRIFFILLPFLAYAVWLFANFCHKFYNSRKNLT